VMPPAAGGQFPPPGPWLLLALVAVVCLLIGVVAISRLALGPTVTVGAAIGLGLRRALPLVAASVLWALPFMLLFVLLLAPYASQPEAAPTLVSLIVLVLMIAYVVVGIHMILITPLAANEGTNPIQIIRRSWQLTRGHWWKLFGFFLLFFVALGALLLAVTSVTGTFATLAGGGLEPLSVSRLLVSLAGQLVSAGGLILVIVMLTRIYAQLSAGELSVPHAP